MTLGEMRQILDAAGLRLTRSLGQNFLHDGNQLRRIVALARVQPGSQVLEIGPGLGPLTEVLLAAGARVRAIEKDARLAPILQERLGSHPHFELIVADALEWLSHPATLEPDWQVVANLPYSVGSRLLVELTSLPHPPTSMTVTLQTEVVDRIRASAGSQEYGVLTLLLARLYEPSSSFRIPASCFFPAPDVESSCVRLDRRDPPLVASERAADFAVLVKLAFSQRRKRVQKLLAQRWPNQVLAEAWERLGISPDARAEELSADTFAQLTRALGTHRA
ncbi:MAG: ribosomal RNA small subunit methyltransferase A [Verrucomicrobiales bacterium]|nr:ribosomal RNA small subunit methyltransferase A [Verrucomicrobiales bacterium]